MIPILYDSSETAFTTNGLGRLSECISCTVTEERNGIYELELQYPVDGRLYEQLISGGIIGAWHDDKHDLQPFDVYKWTAPIDGIVTFYAHHISYRLGRIILAPFSASTCAQALADIPNNAANDCPFTFWTDKGTAGEFELTKPDNARAILGGQTGSILDVFGKGEYEFDKFLVRLYVNRGVNNNVTVRYGKNLSALTDETDSSGIFNAVAPFWMGNSGDEQTVVYLPEIFVKSPDVTGAALPVAVDFSSEFQEQPTEADLRQRAYAYLAANEPWKQTSNIKVSFVQLWQTPEYESVAALQRLSLCDKVNIYYPKLGVIAEESEIIKVVYNVLLERFDSMEIGTPQTTLAQAISQGVQQQIEALAQIVNGKPDESSVQAAIDNATSLITGGLGGYVVFSLNAAGQPQEILVMDTDNVLTAVHVIRINKNGIGFSSTGYQGPFTSAWTIDGSFVADFITSGTMSANLINGGTLRVGGLNNSDGTIAVYDGTGTACGSWTSSGISTKQFVSAETVDGVTNRIDIAYGKWTAQRGSQIVRTTTHTDTNGDAWYGILCQATGQSRSGGIYAGALSVANPNGTLYFNETGFSVTGTKSRRIDADQYGERFLYCYETPTPMFGDIGEGIIGEDGLCYVFLDAIFAESIATDQYQVTLQRYGAGDCFILDRKASYFVVKGEPGLSFGWELKAKQKGFEHMRMEQPRIYPSAGTDYGELGNDFYIELFDGRIGQ